MTELEVLEKLEITIDDLSDGRLIRLLSDHRKTMLKHSPAESVHALDLEAMQAADTIFWKASINHTLAGCAALKWLGNRHAELKSMKVVTAFLGQGVGRALLNHLIKEARIRGIERLSLETGSASVFSPARTLYASAGFIRCEPFDEYLPDPHSVYMTLQLSLKTEFQ